MNSMVRKGLGLVVALLLLTLPGVSLGGVFYQLADTSSDVSGTLYTFEITSLGGTSYNAVLTAQTVNNPADWYIDWFQIKLDGGTAAVITDVNSYPIINSDSEWNALQSGAGIDLAGFGSSTFANNTWSGLYETSAVQGATKDGLNDGPELNGGTYVWNFNFTLSAPFNPTPSFQVGYYDPPDGTNGNIQTTRLSQGFQLSEPGTLLLLGSGLLGLTMLRRKFRG